MFRARITGFLNFIKISYKSVALAVKLAPRSVTGYAITTTLALLYPILFSFFVAKIIDELTTASSTLQEATPRIILLVIGLALIGAVSILINKLSLYLDFRQYVVLSRELQRIGLAKFAKIDEKTYEDPKIQTLLLKISDEYNYRPTQFVQEIIYFFAYFVQAVSIFVVIMKYSPFVALLVLVSAIPELIVGIVFGKRRWGIWDAKGETRKHFWTNSNYIADHKLLTEIKVFGLSDFIINRALAYFKLFQHEQTKNENKRFTFSLTFDAVTITTLIWSMWIVISDVLKKALTVGSFSFYLTQIQQLNSSINTLFGRISRTYEDSLFMESFFQFLDLEEETTSGTIIPELSKKPPTIEIKNLSFKYPHTEVEVLKNINLRINPGEKIAIVGENGAGKSTLIKILMKLYSYDSGQIKINENELSDLELHHWYKNVGTLFQEFNKYYFEPKLNIGVGDVTKPQGIEKIKEAAKRSGADDFIEKYDKAYEQLLDKYFEGGISPSVGQWQRIALARVFFRDAPILILDEPTSAIDPKAEYEIFQRLFEFTQDKTVIIISHRFSTVRNAQKIVVLHEGEIAEQGSHDELMQIEHGRYKTAFELQKKGYE